MIGNKTYSEHDAVTVCRTVSGRLKIAGHQKLYRLTVLAKRLTGRCGAKPPRTKAPHHSPESPTNRKHIRARTIYGPKSSSIIWETMASRMVVFRERFSTFFFFMYRSIIYELANQNARRPSKDGLPNFQPITNNRCKDDR